VFKDKYPLNYYFLGAFTVIMSINVGAVCAVVTEAGFGLDCLIALVLTLTIFVGLTLYTFTVKTDFSYLQAYLFSSLLGLIALGLVSAFFPLGNMTHIAIACFGVLVFCGYVVYDTAKLEHGVWGPDDYIIAAIEIYLDIVNLFLYILEILVRTER
jgi:FtsH-binding integral membrane protein